MGKTIMAFVLGVTVSACMAAKFPYLYYALDAKDYSGELRGPSGADDIPLEACYPNAQDRAPCMVMFTGAFLRMKEAHLKLQIDLDECQRNQ